MILNSLPFHIHFLIPCRVFLHPNGSIEFLPILAEDSGLYTCIATNEVASGIQDVVLYVHG